MDLVTNQVTAATLRRTVFIALTLVAVTMAAFAGAGMMPTGDGALHVNLARQISQSLSLETASVSHYPPVYHIVAAIAYSLGGPAGVQAISFLAFGVISAFTYLFVREVTGSSRSGLAAQVLVTFSPVLLWYSSLTLMEPTLAAVIVATLYMVLRTSREPTLRNIAITTAGLCTISLIKQTGLPIVGAAIVFLAFSDVGIRRTALIGVVISIVAAGPYLYIYSRTGAFTDPGQAPISQLAGQSSGLTGSILTGGVESHTPQWSIELDSEVDAIALYETGTTTHEARHVYWKNVFRPSQFTWVHTLYPETFSGYSGSSMPPVTWILNISLFAGFALAFVAARSNSGWRLVLLTLGVSYIGMSWGSDTHRLFLYVPAIASALLVLPYLFVWQKYGNRMRTYLSTERARNIGIPATVAAIAILFAATAVPTLIAQFRTLSSYDQTQGGGFPSSGGMQSVSETGAWLKEHLAPGESFTAASVYEWEYYSERQDLWDDGLDYRTYFLEPGRLDHYLKVAGAKYIVIRENQVIEDSDWNHVELVPVSFLEKLDATYPIVYTSSFGDIRVYEVTGNEATDA